jgi:hypothetical protein
MERNKDSELEGIGSGFAGNPLFKITDKALSNLPYVLGSVALAEIAVYAVKSGVIAPIVNAAYDLLFKRGF